MKKHHFTKGFLLLLFYTLILTGCSYNSDVNSTPNPYKEKTTNKSSVSDDISTKPSSNTTDSTTKNHSNDDKNNNSTSNTTADSNDNSSLSSATLSGSNSGSFNLSDVPNYTSSPYTKINSNIPYFTSSDLSLDAFEYYSDLDSLGRCGVTFANVCKETMPTEERGKIGMVKPSGWHLVKYDFVDGKYLYNRCHLIGYQLTAENANVSNLITGTRYLNVEGMLPFENEVAHYVDNTNNHVLYRVTPIFEGDNLVASGVLMEAFSVEDDGAGVCFCIFAYNVQPNVSIDYKTGESTSLIEEQTTTKKPVIPETSASTQTTTQRETTAQHSNNQNVHDYILNTNTDKFHYPNCSSVSQIHNQNKRAFTGTREEVISMGYSSCGRCHP